MTRIRTIGLALVAIFAMSAVVASAAQANFTTGSDNTTLTGSGGVQKFLIPGGEISCPSISGTVTGVPTTAVDITAVPVYPATGCTLTESGVSHEAKIDVEGCSFTFTTDGKVHILCPAGKVIKVTLKVAGLFVECLDIHEQTPTTPTVDYINGTNAATGKMDVEVKSTVEGITYERTGVCKKEEASKNEINDAKYVGSVTVIGHSGGNPVDVTKTAF